MVKKIFILGLIGIFLLSGCEQIKELYGIQTTGEEYVPLEEIKIEGDIDEVMEVIEEISDEEEATEAKVLIVEEKDVVTLKPNALDPDEDKLSFTYTSPIDQNGKWETTYGDAGEYTVTITASDGELSATKNVLIIVNKKEEAPVIDDFGPSAETLQAKENSQLEFSVSASDLNKDPLTSSWNLDGNEVSTGESYKYEIGYDGAGEHTIKVVVSDGTEEASKTWTVNVDNVNRKPVLEQLSDIQVEETEKVVIEPAASDPDGDKLTFDIDSDKFELEGGAFEWETTYDDSGEYTIKLSVSDGEDTISQEIKVIVGNVNRAPIIEDIILE